MTSVTEKSPAQISGLRCGDFLVKCQDELVFFQSHEDIERNLKQIKGFLSYFCNSQNHGLWKPFFHRNPKLWGLGRQIEWINSGAFGVISADLSAPILVQWVPCPCFSLFNNHFYKKLSLDIHIPNINLGLVFEFGPQRIRDLAFISQNKIIQLVV